MNSFGIIGTGKSIPSKKITNTFVSKKVKNHLVGFIQGLV